MAKFDKTYCSQCGGEFGPGDDGFSHCDQHTMPRADIIARRRRQQPIQELERKARKANRWRNFSEESKDLSFARQHAWNMQFRATVIEGSGFPEAHCVQCGGFGREWSEQEKRYLRPVVHSPGCVLAPEPPQVYAGTMFTGAKHGPIGILP